MKPRSRRIANGRELGKAKRGEGLTLGSLAIAPLVLGAIAIFVVPAVKTDWVSSATIVWSGALLAFLAGVRRGLTFSEAGGARNDEIFSMHWIFACGVVVLLLPVQIPSLLIAIAGFCSVGILDWRAARKQQAPHYFVSFRPLQTVAAACALAVIAARDISAVF